MLTHTGSVYLAMLAALPLAAQVTPAKKTIDEALGDVREPLTLTSGQLKGAGADRIRTALRTAPFVFIGEDHGLAEIPAFSAALFDELAPLGYRNIVVETGPTTAHRLDAMLHNPDPDAALRAYEHDYPFSLAFYNLREEFDFLLHARKTAGPGLKVIGLDQELMGASGLLLDTILPRHAKDSAGTLLRDLRERERVAYAQAQQTGNPMQLYMMTADRAAIEKTREQLTKLNDPQGAALIDSLLTNRDIYAGLQTAQLASNAARAGLMKRSWVAQFPRDPSGRPQKALFKFGAFHVMKGLNLLNSREIGNYVAEVADGLGTPSVHILIMAAKGNQLRFAGIGRPMQPSPVDQVGPGQSDFPFAKPMFERALLNSSEWSVFDLRALREYADRTRDLDPRLIRMVMGFDFAVIIPNGTPSSQIQ